MLGCATHCGTRFNRPRDLLHTPNAITPNALFHTRDFWTESPSFSAKIDLMQQFRDASVATEDEVRGVLELHLQNRDLQPGVSTRDLAEAMRVSEAEVEALLATVRAKAVSSQERESELARAKRRKKRDVRLATIVAVLILTPILGSLYGPVVTMLERNGMGPQLVTYYIRADGTTRSISARIQPERAAENRSLPLLLADEAELLLAPRESRSTSPLSSRAELVRQIEAGELGPDFKEIVTEIYTGVESNRRVKIKLPTYSGDDRELRAGIDNIRANRISQALAEIAQRARLKRSVGN